MIIAKFLWLCEDCLFASVTREAFDQARGPKAPPYKVGSVKRLKEIEAAIDALGEDVVPDYRSHGEGHIPFSKVECDCCRTPNWGERYRFALLSKEQEEATAEEEATPLYDTDIEDLLRSSEPELSQGAPPIPTSSGVLERPATGVVERAPGAGSSSKIRVSKGA